MFRKHKGKFAAGSRNCYQSGNVPQTPQKKKKAWKWVLLTILLILLALIAAIVIFVITSLNKIQRADPNVERLSQEEYDQLLGTDELDPDAAYPTVDENSITFSTTPDGQVIGKEDHIVNILLIGQDRREGEGRSRSDSMILVSFNKKTNKITMASFLRDNYVQLPDDYLPNRLNAAYAIGGMEMLDETLEINFGVSVDANLEVDFSSFSSIIDILGGVDIELTEAEASHMNGENGWGLTGGMNHLDGEQALTYSRIRKLDSDFGRTNRQRNVLTSLFQAFKNIDLTQALGLINEIFPLLTTDMSNAEMIGYVTDLLPMLAKAELTSVHIPGDEDYYNATIRGMMVLVPDLDACREVLAEALQ